MPLDPDAATVVTALTRTPAGPHGLVRDLRVRWALEEIGRPYRAELIDWSKPKPEDYIEWQPFNQVPALDDDGVRWFESGAILLHIGEQDQRLLPRDPQARANAVSWLFAALNSLEPVIFLWQWAAFFKSGEAWTREALPGILEFLNLRLGRVETALRDNDWIAGQFGIADIMMVTVLRQLMRSDVLDAYPKLKAYRERGEARPAFQRALADHLADLGDPIPMGEPE